MNQQQNDCDSPVPGAFELRDHHQKENRPSKIHGKRHLGAKAITAKDFSSQPPSDVREFSAVIVSDRHGLATNPAGAMLIGFQFKALVHESKELIPVTVIEKASEGSQALEEFTPSAQALPHCLIPFAAQGQNRMHQKGQ